MTTFTLITAIIALAIAYLAKNKANELDERLLDMSSNHYRSMDKLERELEELKKTIKSLEFKKLKEKGGKVFTKDTKIGEAVSLHPEAQTVFASFHLGGCSSCAVSDEETIEEGAKAHNVDLDKLLEALNNLD